ncbi:cell division protein PerM [Actinokineospora sp. NPDC004072]
MALLDEARPQAVRARTLLIAAAAPLLAGYTAIAALFAVVTAVAPRASLSVDGVLAAALPGWLAAHQVPLVIADRALGALPLLPSLLLALLVGRTTAAVARRVDARGPRETGWIAGAVVLAHAVAGLLAALLVADPLRVDPLAGFYYPALLSGAACVVALARRSDLITGLGARVDPLAVRGLRAGLLACAALAAVGAAVVVLGLVTGFDRVASQFTGGFGAALGQFLLSLGYLPNAVLAGLGFAAGPGFGIGSVSVGPLGFHGGAVPGVPLLGALPAGPQVWWPALLALPLAVGLLVGWVLRAADESAVARLRAVAVAAVVAAAATAVLAGSAGGALGGGPFDPLDLRAAALSLAVVAWVGVPAALVAWFAGPHPAAAGLIGPDDDGDETPEGDQPEAADDEPGDDQPDGDQRNDDQPDDDQPDGDEPNGDEPDGDEPSAAEQADESEEDDGGDGQPAVAADTDAADQDH